tara:strand:- start:1478 stop:1810 length:333 start_codon:yes stop_codon:yes gene_type:complete
MNNLPNELILHICTYVNVLSSKLKNLLEINKRIRKILNDDLYTTSMYPYLMNESVSNICNSYLSYINYLNEQKRESKRMNLIMDELYDEDNNLINDVYSPGDAYVTLTPF